MLTAGSHEFLSAFVGHSVIIHSFSRKDNVSGIFEEFNRENLLIHLKNARYENCDQVFTPLFIPINQVKFIEFLSKLDVPVVKLVDSLLKNRSYAQKRYSRYHK